MCYLKTFEIKAVVVWTCHAKGRVINSGVFQTCYSFICCFWLHVVDLISLGINYQSLFGKDIFSTVKSLYGKTINF